MLRRDKDLAGKVAVVTGAASGIGLATVQGLTGAGVHTVCAGRQQEALDDAVNRFARPPGRAIARVADMRRDDDADALADAALDAFGRLDIWVNNAAVTAFGEVDELPLEVFRGVIETNLFGYLHGMRAALKVFRRQGRGTIVNVNSGVVFARHPKASAYVASKHAIRAVSDVLRMELICAGEKGIHVCSLYPGPIDTPLFASGANYTGQGIQPLTPIHSAEEVARGVMKLVRRPRAEASVGVPRRLLLLAEMLAPNLTRRGLALHTGRRHFTDKPTPATDGNVFAPLSRIARISGGWKR